MTSHLHLLQKINYFMDWVSIIAIGELKTTKMGSNVKSVILHCGFNAFTVPSPLKQTTSTSNQHYQVWFETSFKIIVMTGLESGLLFVRFLK